MRTLYLPLLILILAFLPMMASADESGKCGSNVTYNYVESTHTLTISGTGGMANYPGERYSPWYSYSSEIFKAIIEDGVTSIGYYAFSNCPNLSSITLPNSVTRIGDAAFYECSGLISVTIPHSVTSIGASAFSSCI